MKTVEIEMFVDLSCPWCHGALETSSRMLDELASDPDVPPLALTWRFMRLHPMPREGGLPIDEYFSAWATTEQQLEQARQEVRDFATSVGVVVDFSRYTFLHDPLTAHRLLAAIRDDGGHELPSLWSVARSIFSANFVHGEDISDTTTLASALARTGLVLPDRIWKQVSGSDGYLRETLADHARAVDIELDGVPRMFVGGTIVPTWLDPVEVRNNLRAAIASAT